MKQIDHLPVEIGYEYIPSGTKPVKIDVLLHTLMLGKSRTGKSTAMLRAILGTINAGLGCAVIDPHGPLADAILKRLTPEQLKRVVYANPLSHKPVGIGYFDSGDSELALQHFESNMEIRVGGNAPRSMEIFRAVGRAVMAFFKHPTMLHVYKMINRDAFARSVFSQVKDPLVQDFYDFWYSKDMKAKDRHDAFGAPRNKIDELMQPIIREIVAQQNSLGWAKLMDERKIVIIDIRKGKIGANKAKTIGNLALMNMMLAASNREHPEIKFPIFVDEFHNFTDGIDVETMFAEAAKWGISYFVASQALTQLRDEERRIYNDDIALGNCSNVIAFRVSGKDAKKLAEEFANVDMAPAIVELDNYTLYAWTLINDSPILKGPVSTLNTPPVTNYHVPYDKALAWAMDNIGTDRAAVIADILQQLEKTVDMPLAEEEKKLRKKIRRNRAKKGSAARPRPLRSKPLA